MSGFMTGTVAKGEVEVKAGGSLCEAEGGEGNGADDEGSPGLLLDGWRLTATDDTEDRPSKVSVEAFSRPLSEVAAARSVL
jgi:hypothetical protein